MIITGTIVLVLFGLYFLGILAWLFWPQRRRP
jgi:cbb3-type cytochrome oxidase subunit 3